MTANYIEKLIGEYIRDHYNSAIEIGFGGKTIAAEIIRNSGCNIKCTDIKPYQITGFHTIVDDIFEPTLKVYEGTDVIYSIRPGCEMVPPMIELTNKISSDLIVYHLGVEIYKDGGKIIDLGDICLHKYAP